MSNENEDRFKGVDKALAQVRTEFDDAIDGSKEAGGEAREEVRVAIGDIETRIDKLRKRTRE